MAVTAALVKELRERTAAGMLDCKKALVETNGDIELAIENMRKSGQAKAAKKAGNIAAEGQIIIKDGVLVEVNCQTDFVAKDDNFANVGEAVAAQTWAYEGAEVAAIMAQVAMREQSDKKMPVVENTTNTTSNWKRNRTL